MDKPMRLVFALGAMLLTVGVYAAGEVDHDDFEYRKAELFALMGLGEPPEPREPADAADEG